MQREKQRRASFKASIDATKSRRDREQTQISIRKKKKEERLAKRRRSGVIRVDASVDDAVRQFPQMRIALASGDPTQTFQALRFFRGLLSKEQDPPVEEILRLGALAMFIQFLSASDEKLVFEALWCITNIASGTTEQAKAVAHAGALPLLARLCSSQNLDIREQAIWAVGNLAGDCVELRDFVLASGALVAIAFSCTPAAPLSILRTSAWTLSNCCRGKPLPPLTSVQPLIPVFAELLASDDMQLLEDSLWGLSYLCDGPNERIQAILKHDVVSRVVPLLSHPRLKIKAAALRLVGNIASGDDGQTQLLLHSGALDPIILLLNSPRASTRKEAVWLLSNVAAGTPAQKQLLFEKRVYPRLLVLYGQSSFTIRKEIIWTVSNALSEGTAAQAAHFIKIGFIKPLLAECEGADVELVKIALQAISQLLRVQEAATMAILTENDAAATFEALQQHRDHDVYDAAIKLIEDYFDGIEDIEDVEDDVIDLTVAESMMF